MNRNKNTLTRDAFLMATILGIALFLVGLHRIPVPTVDGAVRASEARNLLQTGVLWPISYQGEVITDHPPLYIWVTAFVFKLFGVSDFSANLAPRLFAAATLPITALLALELGLSFGATILSVLILATTRDFILSSVRGYIEPLLQVFFYLAFLFFVCSTRERQSLNKRWIYGLLAGALIFAGAFSKGPVVLWPVVFLATYGIANFVNAKTPSRRRELLQSWIATKTGFATLTVSFVIWASLNDHWPFWTQYLRQQVLGSALEGRGGAQQLEPLFFVKILAKYYLPWFFVFLFGVVQLVRKRPRIFSPEVLTLVFAAGFIGGFSLMKWKFWYYIAPAYPAMAIFSAVTITNQWPKVARTLESRATQKLLAAGLTLWIILANVLPIPLHHDRIPEVLAFQKSIFTKSPGTPIWFVENLRDHNMVGTSGEWYYGRPIRKVTDTAKWAREELVHPSLIIVGRGYVDKLCTKVDWCRNSHELARAGESVLLYWQ